MDEPASPATSSDGRKGEIDPAEFVALQAIVQVLVAGLATFVADSGKTSATRWVQEITTVVQDSIQAAPMSNNFRDSVSAAVERILGGISFG